MNLGCKAYDTKEDVYVTITGTWETVNDMVNELNADGYTVCSWWEE